MSQSLYRSNQSDVPNYMTTDMNGNEESTTVVTLTEPQSSCSEQRLERPDKQAPDRQNHVSLEPWLWELSGFKLLRIWKH